MQDPASRCEREGREAEVGDSPNVGDSGEERVMWIAEVSRNAGGMLVVAPFLFCGFVAVYRLAYFYSILGESLTMGIIALCWLFGVVLFVGGGGLRNRREWARRLLVATSWALLLVLLILLIYVLLVAVRTYFAGWSVLSLLVPVVLSVSIGAKIWLAQRFLRSDETKKLCWRADEH
ncbi:MAG: hypothetical protein AMK75_03405 [Planctomycetes bacterium SM23_65]|nr:MAG: hypothetical protein AMK75_03405 [Planctomycetes bacterium SM23_65]